MVVGGKKDAWTARDQSSTTGHSWTFWQCVTMWAKLYNRIGDTSRHDYRVQVCDITSQIEIEEKGGHECSTDKRFTVRARTAVNLVPCVPQP
jgi:hypothetical protein